MRALRPRTRPRRSRRHSRPPAARASRRRSAGASCLRVSCCGLLAVQATAAAAASAAAVRVRRGVQRATAMTRSVASRRSRQPAATAAPRRPCAWREGGGAPARPAGQGRGPRLWVGAGARRRGSTGPWRRPATRTCHTTASCATFAQRLYAPPHPDQARLSAAPLSRPSMRESHAGPALRLPACRLRALELRALMTNLCCASSDW